MWSHSVSNYSLMNSPHHVLPVLFLETHQHEAWYTGNTHLLVSSNERRLGCEPAESLSSVLLSAVSAASSPAGTHHTFRDSNTSTYHMTLKVTQFSLNMSSCLLMLKLLSPASSPITDSPIVFLLSSGSSSSSSCSTSVKQSQITTETPLNSNTSHLLEVVSVCFTANANPTLPAAAASH